MRILRVVLVIVLSLYATASFSQSPLSQDEAYEKIQKFVGNPSPVIGDLVTLPSPGNPRDPVMLKRYYQALKDAGYISGWEETPAGSGQIELRLTERGQRNILTGESGTPAHRKYFTGCCAYALNIEVTSITIYPLGSTAGVEFTVEPSGPLEPPSPIRILRMVKGEKESRISGLALLSHYGEEWQVEGVHVNSGGRW